MTSSHDQGTFHPHTPLYNVSTAYQPADSACTFRKVLDRLLFSRRSNVSLRSFPLLPPPTQDRLDASLIEQPIDLNDLAHSEVSAAEEKGKTVLYLAYGSNLCKETFRGKRGIKPLSQVNVMVPELRLTFDLPGIPYTEPCFANTALRDPTQHSTQSSEKNAGAVNGHIGKADYHKDRWHKGLVGCVYEVTPSDYAHIIATEGGGSSYKDILVTCYPLHSSTVPDVPTTEPFKAHTLFAPAPNPSSSQCLVTSADRFHRPDPSYAQPSARYLKLLTDGARELSLPSEYQAYLNQIRPYRITSTRQRVGQALFAGIWLPFIILLFALQSSFQGEKGRSPKWLTVLSGWLFAGMWRSYDGGFRKVFGDGERTEEQEGDGEVIDGKDGRYVRSGWNGER
ncbi:hypothetical protein K469DRAFT_708255 [Zopfia rhizophila CBS 207.26]|uniref:gamma-glutamylcyclotransferase n=1 Tax=Zopfia rhizophila CBS 207.26 TaxID=1314779 RepID=A0A6A6E1X0_9PEZI|nr:hypothetical protein K469DRAFT_708255 [Zopfia rhizophila CBS 207.26]